MYRSPATLAFLLSEVMDPPSQGVWPHVRKSSQESSTCPQFEDQKNQTQVKESATRPVPFWSSCDVTLLMRSHLGDPTGAAQKGASFDKAEEHIMVALG